MPRGRVKKPESFEEEILALDKQIEDLSEKLKAAKALRKARVKEENENKDAKKWALIQDKYSADEVLKNMGEK